MLLQEDIFWIATDARMGMHFSEVFIFVFLKLTVIAGG
jgi:hypothetical protein